MHGTCEPPWKLRNWPIPVVAKEIRSLKTLVMTLPVFMRVAALLAAALLCACTTTGTGTARSKPRSGSLTSRESTTPGLATKPAKGVTTIAKKRMYVRTTAYHHSEPGGRVTAVGGYLRPTHSAAADWSWLPAGTKFRIVETGEDYIIEDYGSALVGKYTIDLYKSTRSAMNKWGVRYVNIEITEMGSYPVSLAVLKPRQKYWHVRAMVAGLNKKLR
jgi:3D (Asp-Asp-Asp) domain-containing protein